MLHQAYWCTILYFTNSIFSFVFRHHANPKPATERKKGTTEPELLRQAVLEVIEKQVPKAIASREYPIPRATLRDYVKRISKNSLEVRSLPLSFFSPRYATRRIFTDEQEWALVT